jgi:hypothetical protein
MRKCGRMRSTTPHIPTTTYLPRRLQNTCRDASKMSSFVDDTSSLTTLTATQPRTSESAEAADPAEVAEASTAPVGGKQKRKRTSWIWTHGEEVSVDGAAYWQCSLCENRVER